MVSPAISIKGGWYVCTIDMGRDEDQVSVLARRGAGESRAGAAACCGDDEAVELGCDDFSWGPEKEVVVGDLGAPKAVINERTMQGVSVAHNAWHFNVIYLCSDPLCRRQD